MKLNNKGFAITSILYGLLIIFALMVGSYLIVLSVKKKNLDNITQSLENDYFGETPEITPESTPIPGEEGGETQVNTFTLTFEKENANVDTIYYRVRGQSQYTSTENIISIEVNNGTIYDFYGKAASGYTMAQYNGKICTNKSPCSITINGKDETIKLMATQSGQVIS